MRLELPKVYHDVMERERAAGQKMSLQTRGRTELEHALLIYIECLPGYRIIGVHKDGRRVVLVEQWTQPPDIGIAEQKARGEFLGFNPFVSYEAESLVHDELHRRQG